ncbi:MAG TPA: reactive intermediate/imine deaminase [Saprospirales bacterium]|nr:reactive intermediate/imine deaminase [Saprospirales bacterium]HAY71608.1 reactive intermediate/imine deaminase [Saprospirales bacterium]HRQ30146.1 RidA family protein [Saprospiraceae bacterium]
MKQIINSPKAPAPVGPYNQAILAGNTLFVSGQIPIDPANGQLINDSIESATRQVLNNIGNILEHAGFSFDHVVKCSVFVTDMNHFAKINAVYAEFFKEENAPARELVQVGALPKFVDIEISAIAVK